MSVDPSRRDPHGRDIADAMAANEHASDPLAVADRRLWRYLILDAHDEADPVWLIATVSQTFDVRRAAMNGRRYTDWPEVTEWVRDRLGGQPRLIPAAAMVWLVDEQRSAPDAGTTPPGAH